MCKVQVLTCVPTNIEFLRRPGAHLDHASALCCATAPRGLIIWADGVVMQTSRELPASAAARRPPQQTKQRTKQKDNLLYLAIKSKSKKLVKLFAHYFVQDGQIDDENPVSGLTSFMLAALSNLQSIAIFLLGHCGANKDHRNRYQETSLHIAKRKKLSKAVQFLQKLGCR